MSPETLHKEKDLELERSDVETHPVVHDGLAIEDLGGGIGINESGLLGKMWMLAKKVDQYGIEIRGIERVLESQKGTTTRKDLFDNLWFWLAADCTIPPLALGMLGPSKFGLSGKISILIIIMFNLLGNLPVSIFATFGPKLGLRQMTITRFSFGFYVSWVSVAFNIISCVGSATINSIVGAQALRAVSTTHKIPTSAALVIIAVLTFIAPFFGYKVVHTYERYAWLPVAIIYFIMLGMSVKYVDLGSIRTSTDQTANIISYGAACYGFGMGWATYGADYTVQISEKVHSGKIFALNYLGLNASLILIECFGAALGTVTREDWRSVIEAGDVGGTIAAILKPTGGFAKFCLVLMALSIVAINVPIMYSFALTFQVFGRYAQAIPRIFLVILGTIAYIILAVVGASHFNAWLDSLLVVLGYWLSIYSIILLEEHVIFRRCRWSNYNVEDYNDATRLPLGIAGLFSMCCGIVGAVLGMANLWYIGVVGKMVGNSASGGDIGWELSLAFTAVTYPPLRALEKRWENSERSAVRSKHGRME